MADRDVEENQPDQATVEQRTTAPTVSDRDLVRTHGHMDAMLYNAAQGAG